MVILMNLALYVFGFVPKGTLPGDLEIDGLEPDHKVIQEEFSDINAVVSTVPLSEFVGEEAELRLQDIEWVAPRAVNHQRAIEKMSEFGPILPAQFGVLFSSRDNLERFIRDNLSDISEFLSLTSDKNELGVKVYWENLQTKKRLMETEFAARLQQLASLSNGARYFKEKQLNSEIEKNSTERLRSRLVGISTVLSNISHSSRKRKIVIDDSTEEGRQIVANWAFLVEKARSDEFVSIVNDFNSNSSEDGISLRISGPWPPYSFVPSLIWEYN
ncbi:MAG: GvpL/GvpF family gas vesicle protein [Desulfomonilaceae bacterium]